MTTTGLVRNTQKHDERKHTEIQVQILKKSLIIVERFSSVFYNIAYAQTTNCVRSNNVNDSHGFKKRCVFVDTDESDVTWLLSWIYYDLSTAFDVHCRRFFFFEKMQTLGTLFERHKCLMCMRSKAVLSVQIIQMHWKFFQRINIICVLLILVSFIFTNILLQCVVHVFRSASN